MLFQTSIELNKEQSFPLMQLSGPPPCTTVTIVTVSPLSTTVSLPSSDEVSTPLTATKILLGLNTLGCLASRLKSISISDIERLGSSRLIDGLPTAFFTPPRRFTFIMIDSASIGFPTLFLLRLQNLFLCFPCEDTL